MVNLPSFHGILIAAKGDIPMQLPIPHEKDLAGWAFEQAEALRSGRTGMIDVANIAEALEEMGRNEQRALRSHLAVLLGHLTKHVVQPGRRGRSWTNTIERARLEIADAIAESPSLGRLLEDEAFVHGAWRRGALDASGEMGMDWRDLPGNCPWPMSSILDDSFFPDAFPDEEPGTHPV